MLWGVDYLSQDDEHVADSNERDVGHYRQGSHQSKQSRGTFQKRKRTRRVTPGTRRREGRSANRMAEKSMLILSFSTHRTFTVRKPPDTAASCSMA